MPAMKDLCRAIVDTRKPNSAAADALRKISPRRHELVMLMLHTSQPEEFADALETIRVVYGRKRGQGLSPIVRRALAELGRSGPRDPQQPGQFLRLRDGLLCRWEPDPALAADCVRTLAVIDPTDLEVGDAVFQCMMSDSVAVQLAAVHEWGKFRLASPAWQTVADLAHLGAAPVRLAAIGTLAKIADKDCREKVLKALAAEKDDPDPRVRRAVARALRKLGRR
jgi:hypothetical protein